MTIHKYVGLFLMAALGIAAGQQPGLQITSPTNMVTINPGQTLRTCLKTSDSS